jgi:hypothetical protein
MPEVRKMGHAPTLTVPRDVREGPSRKMDASAGPVKRSEPEPFDPEGEGYDYDSAKAAGLEPKIDPDDGLPHWPSREPKSGTLLKGRKHPTFQKGVDADAELGYKLRKRDDGRYETHKDE